jgi:uncharacterized protein (DUF1778 family)
MSSSTILRKPLGIRATPKEHKLITQAAKRERRSVNSFVLSAALQAAEAKAVLRPKRTPEEIKAILDALRASVQAVIPKDRDILAEFLVERRAEAARE